MTASRKLALSPSPAAESQGLALLDKISTLLQEAQSVDDFKAVRDAAETARNWAKKVKLGLELQNRAAEVRLRAERRLGEFLATQHLSGGDRRSKLPRGTLKLEDLGITKKQSHVWQRMAGIPLEPFEHYVTNQTPLGLELTGRGLLRFGATLRTPPSENGKKRRTKSAAVANFPEPLTMSAEVAAEVLEHLQMLQSLLSPAYSQANELLKTAQREHAARLFRVIERQLRQVLGRPR